MNIPRASGEVTKIIRGDQGAWAGTTFLSEVLVLRINHVFVPPRQRGAGHVRSLIEPLVKLATEYGADTLNAQLDSEDELALATKFFGDDAITVTRRGAGGQNDRTLRAELNFPMSEAATLLEPAE
jgi:hypothetical protein